MLKKLLTLTLAVMLMMALFVPVTYADVSTMFVYTENGKGLNVRSEPFVGDNIIGSIPYGSEVGVDHFLNNGWACIVWGGYGDAYVQSRFLQWYAPGPKPQPSPTSKPTAKPSSDSFESAVNAEFRSAKMVDPYLVTVRPARASSWVNLRWAPNKGAEIIGNYKSGAQLSVLAELTNWLQVTDLDTGATGFIMKEFTSKSY